MARLPYVAIYSAKQLAWISGSLSWPICLSFGYMTIAPEVSVKSLATHNSIEIISFFILEPTLQDRKFDDVDASPHVQFAHGICLMSLNGFNAQAHLRGYFFVAVA